MRNSRIQPSVTLMICGRDVDDDAGGTQTMLRAWTMMRALTMIRACRRDVDDDAGVDDDTGVSP